MNLTETTTTTKDAVLSSKLDGSNDVVIKWFSIIKKNDDVFTIIPS